MNTPTIETHPLEPYIPKNARILMLGTFPPKPERWSMHFFYPNKINDMWRIMGTLFYNDKNRFWNEDEKKFILDDIKAFLDSIGLALYDTAKRVRRLKDNASDKFLEIVEPTDVKQMLKDNPTITAIVTAGEKATETICTSLQIPNVPKVNTFVTIPNTYNKKGKQLILYRLPSSSRAYPLAFEKKVEAYRCMFEMLM